MYSYDWFFVLLAALAVIFFVISLIPLIFWGVSFKQFPGNESIMENAKGKLKGFWEKPIAVVAIVFGIMILLGSVEQTIISTTGAMGGVFTDPGAVNGLMGFAPIMTTSTALALVRIAIQSALTLGVTLFFIHFTRRVQTEIEDLFIPFRKMDTFLYAVGTQLLLNIFVVLWSLLFVIPGIVAAYSYSMAMYILADEPELTPMEVLRKSKAMMKGHKSEYFWLCCRFIGWGYLVIFTCGIGLLWLRPYFSVSTALFYDSIRDEYEVTEKGIESKGIY